MARHFTKQEIEEIRKQLSTTAVRDLELPETLEMTDSDYVAVVQNGVNKKFNWAVISHAENERIANENERVNAENARAAAEVSRSNTEETRVEAEESRVLAENARVNAEASRVDVESSRVNAEAARALAENARVEAETARKTQAGADHTRAEGDHEVAVGDHTQAGEDHAASSEATDRANEAAAAAEHMVDIHRGPKGDQGNTGSSVDYPYELVNNVTTDDATKGLSAAQGVVLDGKISQLGQQVIYDVTMNNSNHPTFASLLALLSDANLSTLIPANVRCGGMSIRFVQTSDNKYIQARCMADSFTTDVTQWQGVDDEPTANSRNLVESGGVSKSNGIYATSVNREISTISIDMFDLGNITMTNSGWTYVNNTKKRVRVKEGLSIFLQAGDVIGLSDYANYRYLLGWRDENGNYGTKSIWLTSDIIAPVTGDYVIEVAKQTAEQDVDDISLFVNLIKTSCKRNILDIVSKNDRLSKSIGSLQNRTYAQNEIVFTSDEISKGTIVKYSITGLGSNNVIRLFDANSQILGNLNGTGTYTIPDGFYIAKAMDNLRLNSLTTDYSNIDLKTQIDNQSADFKSNLGIIAKGVFSANSVIFTSTEVPAGIILYHNFTKNSTNGGIRFFDSNDNILLTISSAKSPGIVVAPDNYSYAIACWGDITVEYLYTIINNRISAKRINNESSLVKTDFISNYVISPLSDMIVGVNDCTTTSEYIRIYKNLIVEGANPKFIAYYDENKRYVKRVGTITIDDLENYPYCRLSFLNEDVSDFSDIRIYSIKPNEDYTSEEESEDKVINLTGKGIVVSDSLSMTCASCTHFAYDTQTGLVGVVYIGGWRVYGEAGRKTMLSIFNPVQPSNIRYITVSKIGESLGNGFIATDIVEANIILLRSCVWRVMLCIHYNNDDIWIYRDYDFETDTLSDAVEIKASYSGSLHSLSAENRRNCSTLLGGEDNTSLVSLITSSLYYDSDSGRYYGCWTGYSIGLSQHTAYPILFYSEDNMETIVPFAVYQYDTNFEANIVLNSGRIHIQCRNTNTQPAHQYNRVAYSDDNGATWTIPTGGEYLSHDSNRPRTYKIGSDVVWMYGVASKYGGRCRITIKKGSDYNTAIRVYDIENQWGLVYFSAFVINNQLYLLYSDQQTNINGENVSKVFGKDVVKFVRIGNWE